MLIFVEVLSLVFFFIKEKYFIEIQVWYNDKNFDFVIIGKMCNKDFDFKYLIWEGGFDYYLFVCWLDVKVILEEFIERVKKLFMLCRKNEVEGVIKKY